MLIIKIIHFKKSKIIKILFNSVTILVRPYNLSYLHKPSLLTARVVFPYLAVFSRCGWNMNIKKFNYVSFSR